MRSSMRFSANASVISLTIRTLSKLHLPLRAMPATGGPVRASGRARPDVLVVVEDVVGVVPGLHGHQAVVDGVAVRLADPGGALVGVEEVDVDAIPKAAERGEER